jgi:putative salt-induced outer membrane protein YdiY
MKNMSIETEIKELTAAIKTLGDIISNMGAAAKDLTVSAVTDEPPRSVSMHSHPLEMTFEAAEQKPQLTAEEVNARLKQVAIKMQTAVAINQLMTRQFGASSVKDIDPSRYLELVEKAEGLVAA